MTYTDVTSEARAHLGAAISQSLSTDNAIIMDHVRAAYALLAITDNGMETAQLRSALSDLFQLIEDGVLVRDISKDHEPTWALRAAKLVSVLNVVFKLLGRDADAAQDGAR